MRIYIDFDRTLFNTWEWYRMLEARSVLWEKPQEWHLSELIFPDAREFLKRYHTTHDLILLTFGERELQHRKVHAADIEQYFSEEIYTEANKKAPYVADARAVHPKEQIVFVDDDYDHTHETQSLAPDVVVLRMTRKEGKFSFGTGSVKEVSNFDEVAAILPL